MRKYIKVFSLAVIVVLILCFIYNNFKQSDKIIIQSSETASEIAEILAQKHFQSENRIPFNTVSKGKYWVSTLDFNQYMSETYGDELVTVDLDCRVVIQKSNGKILLLDGNVMPLQKAMVKADKNEYNSNIEQGIAVKVVKLVLEEKFKKQLKTENFSVRLKDTDSEEYKDDCWLVTYSDETDSIKVLMRKYNGEIVEIVRE